MTEGDEQSEKTDVASAEAVKVSPLRAIVEWFWRGRLLARRRNALPEPGVRATELAQRALQCTGLAQDLMLPVEEGEALPRGDAAELYRQAAYWTLCAISATRGGVVAGNSSEATWDLLDEGMLLQATARADRVEAVRNAVRAGSFVYFAELPYAEQRQIEGELQQLVQLLLSKFHEREHSLQAAYQQRGWRLGLIALAGLALVAGLFFYRESGDLAAGKPWRASSKLAGYGCESPAQDCASSPGLFFHTNQDKEPWVEFDLGAEHLVSVVKIENRVDSYPERAVPLTVEVSTDHQHWKSVARRDEVFAEWVASFPAVPAKWLRLRVKRESYLHLNRVRIFP